VTTQVLVENNKSYWELTKKSTINKQMPKVGMVMFGDEKE